MKLTKYRYRTGKTYKLFYGWVWCIQRKEWFGWETIYETDSKEEWNQKALQMMNEGIRFCDD